VRKVLRAVPVVALLLGLAFAQAGDVQFNASEISSSVLNYIQVIVGAGVAVLGVTIGIAAAWRYAKKFLKG